jgi:hypothetical protein
MNLQVPQNAGKFLSSCTIVGFSRRDKQWDKCINVGGDYVEK